MSNNKDFKVKNGIQPTVYHEGLGTVVSRSVGYSLGSASYDSVSLNVVGQDSNSRGFSFNDDGTKMYMVGNTNDSVYQYSLSTAYDLSTASYDSISLSVVAQDAAPYGITFKPDGTKMYVLGAINDVVYQYSLSTAYDLSTASYDSVSFSYASQDAGGQHIVFNNNGTLFYITGSVTDSVYQYSLSTAYDLSTASYSSVSFSFASQDINPNSITFNNDGTKMYMMGNSGDDVDQYSLSTAYNIGTASYDSISFNVTSQTTSPLNAVFNNDGTKMYVLGNNTIYQYSTVLATASLDLSTGSVFEITPTSDIQVGLSNPAASGTVSQGTLLLDGVMQPYELSGAAYDNVSFSVGTQDSVPTGIRFNNDGTKMYMVGNSSDRVHQYTLSTAFDLSTASYDGVSASFSVASRDSTPLDIAFNNDGTKLHMVGNNSDTVYQYTLSTAFNISTASYQGEYFSVTSQETNPYGMVFNNDGTKMYIIGVSSDSVHQYTLSTGFDLSTASYDSVSFSVAGQDTNPLGIALNNDGTKLYIVGAIGDNVYQYTLGSTYTITYDSAIQFNGGTAPDSPAVDETDVITFSTRDGGTTYQAVHSIDGAV